MVGRYTRGESAGSALRYLQVGRFLQLDGGCARLLGFVFLRALHDDLVHPGEFIPGGGLHPIQRFLARRRVIPRRVIVRTRDVSSFMQEHPGGG